MAKHMKTRTGLSAGQLASAKGSRPCDYFKQTVHQPCTDRDRELPEDVAKFAPVRNGTVLLRHTVYLASTEAKAAGVTCEGGWRKAEDCRGEGPREPHLDASCSKENSVDVSGFCECSGGVKRVFDCGTARRAFTCDQVCLDPQFTDPGSIPGDIVQKFGELAQGNGDWMHVLWSVGDLERVERELQAACEVESGGCIFSKELNPDMWYKHALVLKYGGLHIEVNEGSARTVLSNIIDPRAVSTAQGKPCLSAPDTGAEDSGVLFAYAGQPIRQWVLNPGCTCEDGEKRRCQGELEYSIPSLVVTSPPPMGWKIDANLYHKHTEEYWSHVGDHHYYYPLNR